MSEWQNKSDFEINKAVAELRFNPSGIEQQGSAVYMEFDETASCNREFDGCNNPADGWWIIFYNGICLTSPTVLRKRQLWSASWNEDGGRWAVGDIGFSDKNPLRAAMIVFLEMNGVKP